MDDTSIIHAFKLMKIPLMIVRPQGDIQQCNAAAEQLFGYSAGQMIGRPVSDVLGVASVAELNAFITIPR